MYRVLILTNTLKSGGAEKQSIFLSKVLNHNYDVILIVYYGDQIDTELINFATLNKIKIHFLLGNHFSKLLELYKLFHKQKQTIVFSYLATANTINALVGKLAGVKYKIGGIRNSEISPIKLIIQRFLHNHFFDFSVFNNYAGAKILAKSGFTDKKIKIIPNAFKIRTKHISRSKDKPIQILTVARFVQQKDYFTAIKAIYSLKSKFPVNSAPQFNYCIIGYGKLEKQIMEYISLLNLEDTISVHINPENISEYYYNSDIYLSTSLFEGLSNSIMEAMSYSLPIIATNVGDNNRLIENEINGFLVPIGDFNIISERLFFLINNFEVRLKMGKISYNQIKDNFSEETFKNKYISFIQSFTNE